ncbi:MAG: hypothetical protein J5J06_00495 [Phycisphaerae bacterium]|nr:hypothetical protein [Phycisphaerae bacterium]
MNTNTNGNGFDRTWTQVREMIESGRVDEARHVLMRLSSRTPQLQNALGVCWMRLGESARALELYRGMVLHNGGLDIRPEALPSAKINFATALLLSGNVSGCEDALESTGMDGEGVARLRGAIANWRANLGFVRRWLVKLYGTNNEKVVLSFPPGEL